ncbi:MAG TPA: glycosyltransferase family 4 protein [Acidimicrobiales bacterium]|nr:glycosyltransferase family 4 protein [Acidimicrobiales bacterium]
MEPGLAPLVAASGLRRVHLLAWRDLEDVEAGGSEVHAHEIAKRWAGAGLDVTLRTSYAQGRATRVERDGYRVVRKAGRYLVFPRSVLSELAGRLGPWDAVVEIWNGVPFFSPLWTGRKPSIVFLHHVHAEMWRMVMPENERLARAGELLESRLAPPIYRRTPIVTLSESSKRELVRDLGFADEKVTVVRPGIDARFTPGGRRAEQPLVCAVGRLVPVKRYDMLIEAMARVHAHHPGVELVIAGEGYERQALEELVKRLGATAWVSMPGRLDDEEVIDLYRRSWLVASSSLREGWGMTVTEAAACGTPAVATRIAGHEDALVDGETGLLADAGDVVDLAGKIDLVLGDEVLRKSLAEAAFERSKALTWDATARRAFEVLAAEADRRTRRR